MPRKMFVKPVLMVQKRRATKLTPEKAAIRWFGELRRILLDPSLASPGDLFEHAGPVDHANYRRMIGKTGPRLKSSKEKKLERDEWRR